MKKCKNCGAKVPSDSKYCSKCGNSLIEEDKKISLDDYASNDPYHSASSKEEVEVERIDNDDEYFENAAPKESSPQKKGYDHTFAILALVFGALGGLLSIVFGILVLTSPSASKSDKKKVYIGFGLCAAWYVLYFVLIFLMLLSGGQ